MLEYIGYRAAAKERKLKRQYVQHMSREIQSYTKHSCPGKMDDFSEVLTLQLGRVCEHVSTTTARMKNELTDSKEELHTLLGASETAAQVPTSPRLLCRYGFLTAV